MSTNRDSKKVDNGPVTDISPRLPLSAARCPRGAKKVLDDVPTGLPAVFLYQLLIQFAVVTTIFTAMDKHLAKHPDRWDPRKPNHPCYPNLMEKDLSPYYLGKVCRHGLILGFAGPSASEIPDAVHQLRRVLTL